MSETILRILLSELATIRLICKQCGTAVELAIADLDRQQPNRRLNESNCPGCGITMRLGCSPNARSSPVDALDNLGRAWQALESLANFKVQFVLLEELVGEGRKK